MFNRNNKAPILEGKCYFRKVAGRASVRKVLQVNEGRVTYKRLHGPALKKVGEDGETSLQSFRRWITGEVSEHANFEKLDGAEILPTFLVQNKHGVPVFRCSMKRGLFYLGRGYAEKIDEQTIRFNEVGNRTVEMMEGIYGSLDNHPFFMSVKNDRCVVCGKDHCLTRHHVVPKRHKKKLPRSVSCCISNVLFVCTDCHTKYERFSEQEPHEDITDPVEIVRAWRDHFIRTTSPQFLPPGWDIFTTDPLERTTAR